MSTFFQTALQLIVGGPVNEAANRKYKNERDLIRKESSIGRELFGPIPAGNRREFFCLDAHTWIWYEEWQDPATGREMSMTTRYEVHENGILKVQDGMPYTFIEGQELQNLGAAIKLYYEKVMHDVYNRDPATGSLLAA